MPSHALPADAFEIFQLANAYTWGRGGEGGGYHRCVGSVGVDFCYLSLSVLFLSERMNDARAGYWLIAKAFEILFETFNLRWVR